MTNGPEDSLESGGQAFAAVLRDCVSCGLLLVGSGERVRSLNGEAEELLDLPVGANHSLAELPEAVRRGIWEARESGAAVQVNATLQDTSGKRLPVRIWAAPAAQSEGTVLVAINRFLAVGPLEPDLQRLDRLANTGMLSAGLAHEIRNALVPVKTFTDLLLEKNPDAELAGMARRELARVDSILGRLLKFARPPSSTAAPVHLHTTLDYALRLVQHHLVPRSINLRRALDAHLDTVQGDESQLHQAFVNVLMNGVEAMGSAGTLSVLTENFKDNAGGSAVDHLRVTIKDTGPGISAENAARLFEPFFTTKANGTGLGLAVARRIFAEHQGTISVDSRPGEGAAFTMTLPCVVPGKLEAGSSRMSVEARDTSARP